MVLVHCTNITALVKAIKSDPHNWVGFDGYNNVVTKPSMNCWGLITGLEEKLSKSQGMPLWEDICPK